MDMRHEMRPELQQRLVMTPKLQQAIKLLQMPALELQQKLKHELLHNPMLEDVEEPEDEEAQEVEARSAEDEGEFKAGEDEIDWDRYLRDGFEMGGQEIGEREESDDFYERVPVVRSSLEDHLIGQLRMSVASPEELKVGEFIIGSLDSNGFLTCSPEEIVGFTSADLKQVEDVLAVIKTFDPPGVGASDLRESLLIQLDQQGLSDSLAARLVREHLDDLLEKRYREIARSLKKTVKEIQVAADVVAGLDPRPGARYSAEEPRYIVPDLIVDKVEDGYVVQLNDRNIPRLRVSRAYRDILSGARKKNKTEEDYVKKKLDSARWLIKTIDQRRRTMVRVMEAILDAQRSFFDKGVEHIKPLTLQQIANVVEMHESTVSRVTNGKYVQTPRGVYELKYFFSPGLKTDNGEDASSKRIKARIQEMVETEDRKKPLSDQDIAARLKEDGFSVARRTVAKYRDQLGILRARMRKEY
ncbi:MAG: RNA polymerase factor sigma-54 [bacterium]|jgi:RNA polymerase sigma-54 factor